MEYRNFLEAILEILSGGVSMKYNQDPHQHFTNDPDKENILLDSTVVRAHPCAAGALSKKAVGRKTRRFGAAEGVPHQDPR